MSFLLLQQLHKTLTCSSNEGYSSLRERSRTALDLYTKVLEYGWSMKSRIAREQDEHLVKKLQDEFTKLEHDLQDKHYKERMDELLAALKEKEILEHGCSKIGSSSPSCSV